jgi:hypothetical protein
MFEKFPEFITDDPRYFDPDDSSSNINRRGQYVTLEMMEARHKTMLPKEVCEGNSILDLGSCISASGAWALESGALFYTGVEISDDNYESAYFNMREYFPAGPWNLHRKSISKWFGGQKDIYTPFDVVLAAGILYSQEDQISFLTKCAEISKKYLIFETIGTHPIDDDQYPISIYRQVNRMGDGKLINIRCSNEPFISMVLNPLGFSLEDSRPTWHGNTVRFVARYAKDYAKDS